jgi:hypothetical protein
VKEENPSQKSVLMELDFGTKFTLHFWFAVGLGVFLESAELVL